MPCLHYGIVLVKKNKLNFQIVFFFFLQFFLSCVKLLHVAKKSADRV